jgi:starch synthase
MKMGIPIISTACDGIIEDIEHNKSGILVPKENPKAMAKAIERLLNNPGQARKLGYNAKRRYEEKFRPELVAGDIKKLLSTI